MNKDNILLDIRNAFSQLIFDEASHSYTINGKKLLSTTTFIEEFSGDFDAWSTSEAKAKEWNKLNPNAPERKGDYYRRRWDYISKQALALGSRVHEYAECYPHLDEPVDEYEQGVTDFFKYFDTKYTMIGQEIKVYNEQYRKAGTVDILAWDNELQKLVLFDFKTGGSNILQHYKNKKLKEPFKSLTGCGMNKYSIQLSDYINMIQLAAPDLEFAGAFIVWITQKDETKFDMGKSFPKYNIDKSFTPIRKSRNYKIFKCLDLTKELKSVYPNIMITEDKRYKNDMKITIL
jgi:hypothetical protein